MLNPTNRTITIAKNTTISTLASATIFAIQSSTPQQHIQEEPTIAEMRAAIYLQAKSINLDDTAFRGKELDDLIRLLYRNLDIVATSLKDVPGIPISCYMKLTPDMLRL